MISFSLPFRDCIISAWLEWASGFSDCNEWKCIRILLIILALLTQVELRVLWYSYPLRPFLTGEGIIWSCKDEMWLCFVLPFLFPLCHIACLFAWRLFLPPPPDFLLALFFTMFVSNLTSSFFVLSIFSDFFISGERQGQCYFTPFPEKKTTTTAAVFL